ncbi:MAG: TrkA family potassium uptake protein [Spirochaetes bacterium]|uniref:Trk system potassium uptake protein TrkA n=1 Tax=Candidatus Gallitreponema excrementavium TaxID=2840840 RepID=A0A9D9HNR4_9SPIR|nr:TrkA family potassium uptake protein [Candidatus Gallitreponema excrementavium]
MKKNTFAIIGLGRFGMSLAQTLLEEGKDVIVIDNDMEKLKTLKNTPAVLCCIDNISVETLRESGVADCDVVIIGIGGDLEANILAAMDSLELGVKKVLSKANNDEHARILEKIGAEVVFPEVQTAKKLAMKLCNNFVQDIVPFSDDFFIMQFLVPQELDGKTVLEADLRKKYEVNIVAMIIDGKARAIIKPETVLKSGDSLLVSGTSRNIKSLRKALNAIN